MPRTAVDVVIAAAVLRTSRIHCVKSVISGMMECGCVMEWSRGGLGPAWRRPERLLIFVGGGIGKNSTCPSVALSHKLHRSSLCPLALAFWNRIGNVVE